MVVCPVPSFSSIYSTDPHNGGLRYTPADLTVRLAILLHDVAKPAVTVEAKMVAVIFMATMSWE